MRALLAALLFAWVLPAFGETVSISWRNATQNIDGTPFTDHVSTRIYWSPAEGPAGFPFSINVPPSATSWAVDVGNCPVTDHVFMRLTHINSLGEESAYSNLIRCQCGTVCGGGDPPPPLEPPGPIDAGTVITWQHGHSHQPPGDEVTQATLTFENNAAAASTSSRTHNIGPALGELLVIAVGFNGGTDESITNVTNTVFTVDGWKWAQLKVNIGGQDMNVGVAWAQVTGTGVGAITVSFSGNVAVNSDLWSSTNFNTEKPIRQIKVLTDDGTGSPTALTGDFDLTPHADSALLQVAIGSGTTASSTQPSGWTEQTDINGINESIATASADGGNGTSIGNTFASGMSDGIVVLAIEINGADIDEEISVVKRASQDYTTESSPQTFNYFPIQPEMDGIRVGVVHNASSDAITGVTVDGTSMTKVDNEGEVTWFELINSTAVQAAELEIQVSYTGTDPKHIVVEEIYAHGDKILRVDFEPFSGTTEDPRGNDLGLQNRKSVVSLLQHSSANDVASITPLAGWTKYSSNDFGTEVANHFTYDTVSHEDVATGYDNTASENESFIAIGHGKEFVVVVGQVEETDLAQALVTSHNVTVNQVTETDLAQAVDSAKEKAIGQATETDLAQPLSAASVVPVNLVTETDLAQVIAAAKAKAVAQVIETDTPQAVGSAKAKAIGLTSETDLAQAITVDATHVREIAQVTETDVAQSISSVVPMLINQVLETDVAQAITSLKTKLIAQVEEFMQAATIPVLKTKEVGQVSETDLAQPIGSSAAIPIGQANETDLAQPIVAQGATLVNQVVETDVAQALTSSKSVAVAQVQEFDVAQAIGAGVGVSIGQVVEVDFAQAISSAKAQEIAQVTELNEALSIFLASNRIGPVSKPGILDVSTVRKVLDVAPVRSIEEK